MILSATGPAVNVRIDERKLGALGQPSVGTIEEDALTEPLHRAASSHIAVPAKVDFLPIGRIVCPGKQTRHRLAKARKHVCIFSKVSVVFFFKFDAVIIRCSEINLELALNDDRHLNVVALTRLGKGNGQERKAALAVVPIGAWAKRHIVLAVVHYAKRGIVRRVIVLNEHTILELENICFGRHVRIGAILVIQSASVREAAVRDDV